MFTIKKFVVYLKCLKAEKPMKKRRVVYDPICGLRIKNGTFSKVTGRKPAVRDDLRVKILLHTMSHTTGFIMHSPTLDLGCHDFEAIVKPLSWRTAAGLELLNIILNSNG